MICIKMGNDSRTFLNGVCKLWKWEIAIKYKDYSFWRYVKMRVLKKNLLCILFIIFCLLFGYTVKEYTENTVIQEYSNPIDFYFLPRIENAACEADRRELQDIYMCVWSKEFDNVMLWMQDKCVYQEDKDNLLRFTENVESLIETTCTILATDWLDDYNRPSSEERSSWGNGTHSGLNQKKAEIYRDACMKLINDTYIFIEQDYSSAVYE